MTEQEWLTSTDPQAMLEQLRLWHDNPGVNFTLSDRKLRLIACGAARLLEGYHPERDAVLSACEEIADGRESDFGFGNKGLAAARKSIEAVWGWTWCATAENLHYGIRNTMALLAGNAGSFHRQGEVAAILLDIISNPFRPPFDWLRCPCGGEFKPLKKDSLPLLSACEKCRREGPFWATLTIARHMLAQSIYEDRVPKEWLAWNAGTVRRLAQSIYEDRAFDRLPILADALEEAGCTNADILTHCRGDGPHIRGCWVIDLLLGKR